jgi:hypothetical protein
MPRVLVKEAVGIVINPLGVNVPLKMERKHPEGAAAGAAGEPETPANPNTAAEAQPESAAQTEDEKQTEEV